LKITIISVGKIKEKFYKEAIGEFKKRLSSYCTLNLIEVADEKAPENISDKEMEQIKDKEGEKILSKMDENSYVVVLHIQGKQLSSEDLSKKINDLGLKGQSHITFIIGGSLGLSQNVLNKSNFKLSFSKMTFPHQLFKVILLEQVYRSFRIIRGEPYHK
jgi:23S rRNA (pseudouridine1915-N3)-methyltransferase